MPADSTSATIESQLANVPDPVALLATLFEHVPVGFQIYKADGRSLLVNPAFRALFGGEPPPEYNVLEDEIAAKAGVLDLIRRAFGGQTSRLPPTWYDPRELQQVHVSEGRRVAIEATFFPLRNASAEVTHVAVIFADRTELEAEREHLVARETRAHAERDLLHAIIEQSADGIIVADADGKIGIFNPAAQTQHGVDKSEVGPDEWARTFGLYALDGSTLRPEDTPLFQALNGGDVRDARWMVRRPSGELRTLAGSATPLHKKDGSKAGAVLISRDETERLAVDDALRRSEERYRGIVAALAGGITIQDATGTLIEANASAERLLGLSVSDMMGRTSAEPRWCAVDERGADLPEERHPQMVALRTGQPQSNVVMGVCRPDRGRGRGRARVWLSVNAQPLFRPGTIEPMGVVSSFFDITEQREHAEERARLLAMAKAGEEQFRTLANTMPVLAWYAEPDGFIPWFNTRWYEYTGKPLDEQSGWQWTSVHDPADLARVVAKWTACLATGKAFEDLFRLRRHDGVFRWFLTRVEPLRDDEGRIIRWFGTNVDIDDQKRAERSLRTLAEAGVMLGASMDLTTTLGNVARLVVPALADWSAVFLREDGNKTRLAAAAHPDRAKEDAITSFATVESLAGPRFGLDRVLETGKATIRTHSSEPAFDDLFPAELRPTSTLIVPLSVNGRTLGALMLALTGDANTYGPEDLALAEELARRAALAVDGAHLLELTQRERHRAAEANRAKDEFLSVASHELRTPLNAILGWSRMLASGAVHEDRRQHALETIERNARAQVQLVEDILDVSRISTGKLRLEVAPLDPGRVLDAALDVVRPAADAKGVRLQALAEPDAGTVMGDAGRLQQVFWNLMANAVKFTPRGGRVHVQLRREESCIELVVADTGHGIESKFLPHMFEPFRQADGSSTRHHGGLGLGLAIVKHIVELHGGRIEAHSEGLGRGASFTVRIPIAPVRGPTVDDRMAPAVNSFRDAERLLCLPGLAGLRVLVIDDEHDARELVQATLQHCDADVVTAGSALEAMAAIRERVPDVIVSDIGMPGQDGYALIRQIRALSPEEGGRVPAIALTAYARMEDRTRALMEGFSNHLSKPVEPQELLAVVAAVAARGRV